MLNSSLIQLFVFTCLVSIYPAIAAAKCSIEEVEFYLKNDFSQEQITQLCSTSNTNTQDCAPCQSEKKLTQEQIDQLCRTSNTSVLDCSACSQQSVIENKSEVEMERSDITQNKVALVDEVNQSQKEHEAIQALKIGGDVLNFDVTSEKLIYIRKVCVFSGAIQQKGRRREYCHGVNYTISRQNLQASPGKKLPIVGTPNVLIVGNVILELAGSTDDYPYEVRKQLQAFVHENTDKNNTDFPMRDGTSVAELVNALQTLSQ